MDYFVHLQEYLILYSSYEALVFVVVVVFGHNKMLLQCLWNKRDKYTVNSILSQTRGLTIKTSIMWLIIQKMENQAYNKHGNHWLKNISSHCEYSWDEETIVYLLKIQSHNFFQTLVINIVNMVRIQIRLYSF